MPRTLPWILCLTLLLFPHKTVYAQAGNQTTSRAPTQAEMNPWLRLADNGVWRNTLSHDRKSDFVDGYVAAMATVRQTLLALLKEETNTLAVKGDFSSHAGTITYLSSLAERYNFAVDQTKLIAAVDEFYKDSQNKFIKTVFAFQYVRDSLNGKVAPKDLEKQLNEWRETFSKSL